MADRNLLLNMLGRLKNFPANGQLPYDALTAELLGHGFVEEKVQNEPCRECGTARPRFRYFMRTPAAHMLIAASELT
jgi:hypothetical protein